MSRIAAGTYPPYFETYVRLVETENVADTINKYGNEIVKDFENLPAEKAEYSYAPGKWTLKEMLQHVIDTERIFSYRALCIAREDATPLPGFDENSYAANSNASTRTWQSLLAEFSAVRTATDLLFSSFTNEQLEAVGTTNGNPTSAKALVYITYGHLLHHLNIIRQRYLTDYSPA